MEDWQSEIQQNDLWFRQKLDSIHRIIDIIALSDGEYQRHSDILSDGQSMKKEDELEALFGQNPLPSISKFQEEINDTGMESNVANLDCQMKKTLKALDKFSKEVMQRFDGLESLIRQNGNWNARPNAGVVLGGDRQQFQISHEEIRPHIENQWTTTDLVIDLRKVDDPGVEQMIKYEVQNLDASMEFFVDLPMSHELISVYVGDNINQTKTDLLMQGGSVAVVKETSIELPLEKITFNSQQAQRESEPERHLASFCHVAEMLTTFCDFLSNPLAPTKEIATDFITIKQGINWASIVTDIEEKVARDKLFLVKNMLGERQQGVTFFGTLVCFTFLQASIQEVWDPGNPPRHPLLKLLKLIWDPGDPNQY